MRVARSFTLALFALLLATSVVSSQGKDKDKDKDPPKKDDYPSTIQGKDMKMWADETKSKDPFVRQSALSTLPYFGPAARRNTDLVLYYLVPENEADANVRATAATSIGTIGADEKDTKSISKIVTGLSKAALDLQRPVRLHAIGALANFGHYAQPGINNLATAAKDPNSWEVRKAAVQTLGRIGIDPVKGPDNTAFTAVAVALNDSCAAVRLQAVMTLSGFGKPNDPLLSSEIKYLLPLLKDRDKNVVIWTQALLIFLDEKNYLTPASLSNISKMMDDSDLGVRCQAAHALGTLGPKAKPKLKELVEAAKDKELELAVAAVGALGRLDDSDAAATLAGILKDAKAEMRLRCAAAQSIGGLGTLGKGMVPNLIELLKDKDEDLVASVITGLGGLAEFSRSATRPLKDLAKETKNEAIKAHAESTAKYIEDYKPPKKDKN